MRAVRASSFYPAEIQGKKMKQPIQQPYDFNKDFNPRIHKECDTNME